MNNSKGIIKLILFIIVVGVLGGLGYYYYVLKDSEKTGAGVFPSLSDKKISDYKNGIYSYKLNIDGEKSLLSCVISSIDDYLVVINEDYYLYHGNCLNMVFVNQGKTENLKFEKDNDSNYSIKLDNIVYSKDNSIDMIEVGNKVIEDNHVYSIESLKNIVKYSQFPGHYYSFNGYLNSSESYSFNYVYDSNFNNFQFRIAEASVFYTKYMKTFDDIPDIYNLSDYLIIVDKNKIGEEYRSELYIYSGEGRLFDYNSIFPITINGNVIDSNWNRIFRYDKDTKTAYVLFSKSKDFCDFNNNNVFYEFKLSYDYKIVGFKTPDLYKKGSSKKDCTYVKKYYLKEG